MEQNSALDILASKMASYPKSQSVIIGKYKINYVTAGKGSPLLLIHGANIGWAQWHLNIDALAKKHTVYALDLPGAGNSTHVNFRRTKFESDYLHIVDEFIDKLSLKNVDIVGSSFGGWIAMRLAAAHKPYIRKLIVSNPVGFTKYMPPKFRPISVWPLALLMSKTALRPSRGNKNLEKFMRDVFYDKNIPLRPEFVDYFYELSKTSHNVLFISRLAHFKGMRPELVLTGVLDKITVPTMVIWGKQDPLMPFNSVKDNFDLVKDLRLEILDNVGHMPPVENPETFNSLVLDFLKEKAG